MAETPNIIYNDNGLAYPHYQSKKGIIFRDPDRHDRRPWEYSLKRIQHFRTCIDIGGHVGTSAIRYSEHFKRVYTFEPVPLLFECMKLNTKDIDNIKIHNAAAGDSIKKVKLYINQRNSASSVVQGEHTQRLIDSRWHNEKRDDFLAMPSVTVDCINIDSLGLDDIDYVKIDTEGYNVEPLVGMKKSIEKSSPVIQIERGDDENVEEYKKLLTDMNYELFKVHIKDEIYVRK